MRLRYTKGGAVLSAPTRFTVLGSCSSCPSRIDRRAKIGGWPLRGRGLTVGPKAAGGAIARHSSAICLTRAGVFTSAARAS
jgi:hypothetical protein